MPLTETSNSPSRGADEPSTPSLAIRANRYDVLSRLADDLAHEIKNPLNAIVVNLELLRRRLGNGSVDAALERAAVIGDEVQRVHGLVEQLLQLLRPEKNDLGLVAVDAVLENMAQAIQIQAKAARVTFEWAYSSDLYARIRIEGFRFALLNLLATAIDTESPGGQVRVETRRTVEGVYILVSCAHHILPADSDAIRLCRLLMEEAGGGLESVEPNHGTSGSTATVVMRPAGF